MFALFPVYSLLFVARSSSYPHASLVSAQNRAPSSITRLKPAKRLRNWKKDAHQEGRDFFTSMMKPSKGTQSKSPTQMLPNKKTLFKYTPGNNSRSDNEVSSKSELIFSLVTQSLLSGMGKLKPPLLEFIRQQVKPSSLLETSCNLTVRELVQEEGECILFGGWCCYGVDRLKASPVTTIKHSKKSNL